jgi:hypothetical protein
VDDLSVVLFFPVTGKADLIAFFRQEKCFIRGMGIVTGNAFSLAHRGMNIGLVQFQVFNLMADITEVISFFLQQKRCHHAMAKVAFFALFLRNHFVDILPGKILIGKLRMAVQAVFLGKSPFFLGFSISAEHKDDQAAAEKRRSQNG